jgi:hypothetical protein
LNQKSAKPTGLFLNTKKANCSIHESGLMIYECLKLSSAFDLKYCEIHEKQTLVPTNFDFYLFNCHHHTMAWLDTKSIHQLPGCKLNIILEVSPGNAFALTPRREFDAYCVLDPTITEQDGVFSLPRPLEQYEEERPLMSADHPVVGTFGFATPGKGFERVVDAVGREFENATVRVNIPSGDYADDYSFRLQNQNYADYLARLCHDVARSGIRVETTNEYMSKHELISWCAANTINCFLYHRNQPGLAATTDQAISSGRPLSVSQNDTFRHVHQYIEPYPFRSLRESIAISEKEVFRAKQDWSPQVFANKFETILEHVLPILNRVTPHKMNSSPIRLKVKSRLRQKFNLPRVMNKLKKEGVVFRLPNSNKSKSDRTIYKKADINRPIILFISHIEKQCGIHQYGLNIHSAISKSTMYEFIYVECNGKEDLELAIKKYGPAAIIYNHYPATMAWLDPTVTRNIDCPQLGIIHEVTQTSVNDADQNLFDYLLCPDPTIVETHSFTFKTKRLIPAYVNTSNLPKKVTIGSFGFGFHDKGFERIVQTVQEEFESAEIIFQMPYNDIVDKDGKQYAKSTARRCKELNTNRGIDLRIRHKFLSRERLLDFLAGNSINVFFYDVEKHKGISSTIEHALAVQRPIAINKCGMFRHMFSASPSICVEEKSLSQILEQGVAPLVPYMNDWSEAAFIMNYEEIMQKVLNNQPPKSSPTLIDSHPGV